MSVINEKNFNSRKLCSNFSHRHVPSSFDNAAGKKLPRMREQFNQCPDLNKKQQFSKQKTLFWKFFLNKYNAVLTTPLEKFRQKPTPFCSKFKNDG